MGALCLLLLLLFISKLTWSFRNTHVTRLPQQKTRTMFSADDVGVFIYDSQLAFSSSLMKLSGPSLYTFTFLYGAGLLSSVSPCSLSLVPLTSLYLAGSSNDQELESSKLSRSAFYAAGVASTLTLAGNMRERISHDSEHSRTLARLIGRIFGENFRFFIGLGRFAPADHRHY